jgi:hypothetical protein
MGVQTSEVGYTSTTPSGEVTKSIRDMWWEKNIFFKEVIVE